MPATPSKHIVQTLDRHPVLKTCFLFKHHYLRENMVTNISELWAKLHMPQILRPL